MATIQKKDVRARVHQRRSGARSLWGLTDDGAGSAICSLASHKFDVSETAIRDESIVAAREGRTGLRQTPGRTSYLPPATSPSYSRRGTPSHKDWILPAGPA